MNLIWVEDAQRYQLRMTEDELLALETIIETAEDTIRAYGDPDKNVDRFLAQWRRDTIG